MKLTEKVYSALRPRKAQTVGEIVKAMKFERSRVDVALALAVMLSDGRAVPERVSEDGVSFFVWRRGVPPFAIAEKAK